MPDREKVIEGLEKVWDAFNHMEHELYADYVFDALALLKGQETVVRCKDCKWYDERMSLCDNCGLPREQTFFCADGKRKEGR